MSHHSIISYDLHRNEISMPSNEGSKHCGIRRKEIVVTMRIHSWYVQFCTQCMLHTKSLQPTVVMDSGSEE